MPKKRKTLAILASDSAVSSDLTRRVHSIIGGEVDIFDYSLDEGIPYGTKPDAVLASGPFMNTMAEEFFPGIPVVFCKRVIPAQNLEQVIMTPQGQRALVVVHPKEASDDTIRGLQEMGIEHLHLENYWKTKKVNADAIDLAITPGMPHLCPPGIGRVIDIGMRGISVETFMEVLRLFDLDLRYLGIFEQTYVRQLVNIARKIQQALDVSEKHRRFQEVILQDIDEGILMVDEERRLVLCNENAVELFGNAESMLENKRLRDVFTQLHAAPEHVTGTHGDGASPLPSILVRHRGKDLYCSKNSFSIGGKQHSLYTFKAVEQIQELEHNVRRHLYHKGFTARHSFASLWGDNAAIRRAKELAARFAKTEQSILLTGESGTGKELFAQAIHNASHRSRQPFVAVNLGAIPAGLMESELLGYAEGAFTGAKKGGRQGMFELAHRGTIFLDEIGDAPPHIQVLLLRVLEERRITRVGAEETIPLDIRIVCATNKSLPEAVRSGTFRNDLFHRLNVLSIPTIPLRDMREEIPGFMGRHLATSFPMRKEIAPEVMERLLRHDWPGNFRELKNVTEYLYYSSGDNPVIGVHDIPQYLQQGAVPPPPAPGADALQRAILERLAKIHPSSLGRGTLLRQLGADATEGKVKRALALLKNAGLVRSGTTRQGSAITEHGLRVLAKTPNL